MGNNRNQHFCRRISPIQPGTKVRPLTHMGQYPPHARLWKQQPTPTIPRSTEAQDELSKKPEYINFPNEAPH